MKKLVYYFLLLLYILLFIYYILFYNNKQRFGFTNQKSVGFIITRHVNSEKTNNYWIECYKSIRQFYNNKILTNIIICLLLRFAVKL